MSSDEIQVEIEKREDDRRVYYVDAPNLTPELARDLISKKDKIVLNVQDVQKIEIIGDIQVDGNVNYNANIPTEE